jgi:hypothetical protein
MIRYIYKRMRTHISRMWIDKRRFVKLLGKPRIVELLKDSIYNYVLENDELDKIH